MGKASTKANKCIYQIAREELGLTRADATTYIPGNTDFPGMDGVTESRLVKIEHGDVIIQPEDVVAEEELKKTLIESLDLLTEKERKVIELLDFLNIQYYRESECTLKPINPKTGCYMHYDNQIPSLHLIIEVNGEQHYYSNYFTELVAKSRNMTTEDVFNEQLFRDKLKKDYAIQHGYDYLEVPYYTNDKNETYKQLILDKMNDRQSHMKP